MATLSVDVSEAQIRLMELLAKAAEGIEVILTQHEQPLARIEAIASPAATDEPLPPRIADLHPGFFQPSEDFDDPLPDEFWLGEESKE